MATDTTSNALSLPESEISSVDSGEELARLFVEAGTLELDQLDHARRVRGKLPTEKTLTMVIRELGYVSEAEVKQALRANQVTVNLGALLVELGYLLPSDLDIALTREREEGRTLGSILIEDDYIDEDHFVEVLSYQLGFEHVEPRVETMDRRLTSRASPKWYGKNQFIPIAADDNGVVVAFVDPTDSMSRAAAEEIFGPDVIPAIASKSSVMDMIGMIERGLHSKVAVHDDSAVGIVNKIFEKAMQDEVSDVHFEPMKDNLRIRFRRDGVLVVYKTFPSELAGPIVTRIKVMAGADIAEKRRHQDGRMLFEDSNGGTIDMRVSLYVTIHGEKVVVRLLNKRQQVLNIAEIGMSARVLERFHHDALDLPSGVLIVTGPTGSGKTTTLYSAVNYLNDASTSIITAEDPVEYVVDGISQCSINPKIQLTFEETLRHIVRQDPDIIVLGEIRDQFSAEVAIQAALTGQKVLTTFHTEDSIGGLLRLMNMNIEAFLISSTVVCVVAQRLLRRVCESCAVPYVPVPLDMQLLGLTINELRGANFQQGRGCKQCRFTGYNGRVGVFELLVLDERVKDAILQRRTSQEIRLASMESTGLVTLLEDGLVKAARGETSIQEVLRMLPRLLKPRSLQEIRRLLGE